MLRNEEDILTEKKLKKIMKEVLEEYFDPDYGLEVREEFHQVLKKSKEEEENGDLFSIEDMKKEIE